MNLKIKFAVPLVLALWFLPTVASATPVTGDLGITGSATLTAVSFDFFCSLGGCPGTAGDFVVSPIVATGDFSGLGNTRGFIQDISELGGQPLNTNFSLPNWISFLAAPNLHLDLQFISLGQGAPSTTCVGLAFCTPIIPPLISANNPLGLSAFNLTPGSLSVEFRGIAYTGSSATGSTPFIGRFSADFPGMSPADIVALFQNPGITNRAYSGGFTLTTPSATPEPTTMLLLGTGLVGIAAKVKWRKKKCDDKK